MGDEGMIEKSRMHFGMMVGIVNPIMVVVRVWITIV